MDQQQPARTSERSVPHSLEVERALLGSVLLDNAALDLALTMSVTPDDLFSEAHRLIFKVMMRLAEAAHPIEMVTVGEYLSREGLIEKAGGAAYLSALTDGVPIGASVAVSEYCRIIKDKATIRKVINASNNIISRALEGTDDATELVGLAQSQLYDIAEQRVVSRFTSVRDAFKQSFGDIDALGKRDVSSGGVLTGFVELDTMTGGLRPGELTILAARPSLGKAQPLTSMVKIPGGWKSHAQLNVGDEIASIDGQRSVVLGIFPQGKHEIFRITFCDGRKTECCDEHLWSVRYKRSGRTGPMAHRIKVAAFGSAVFPTKKLRLLLKSARQRSQISVPLISGDVGKHCELPVHPWVLGILLGDGNINGNCFTTSDHEIAERMAIITGLQARNYSKLHDRCPSYRLTNGRGKSNSLLDAMIMLGLKGKHSYEKFIPSQYLEADASQRWDLLRGLLDSDGTVGRRSGSISFTSTSPILANNVQRLIWSLGGICSMSSRTTKCLGKNGKVSYSLFIRFDSPEPAFSLKRKLERLKRSRCPRLSIQKIERVGSAHTQCISVSHPSGLYITDDFVVTHNTSLALNIAAHAAIKNEQPVGVFSLEMALEQIVLRLLCAEAEVNMHKLRSGFAAKEDWNKLAGALGRLGQSPLYIDDSAAMRMPEMRAKARRLKSEKGIKLFIVDYLQLMSGDGENRTQEISGISRGLKAMAKELKVAVLALSQLSRGPELRRNPKPQLSDLRESGSIEQDADCVLFIFRYPKKKGEDEEAERDQIGQAIPIWLDVAKQRNGPTGEFELVFLRGWMMFANKAHDSMYEYDTKAAAANDPKE